MKSIRLLLAVGVSLVTMLSGTASAQQADCGTYSGVQCDGWFTDDAGVTDDPAAIEARLDALVAEFGHEIAFVIVQDAPGDVADFAAELGNAWGVGSAESQDGVVVLVSLADRRTEVVTGPGIALNAERIAQAGNSGFGAGDFDQGASDIAAVLESQFRDIASGEGVPDVGTDGSSVPGNTMRYVFLAGLLGAGGVAVYRNRERRNDEIRSERAELIDGVLAKLDPAGHELPRPEDFEVEPAAQHSPVAVTTAGALATLDEVAGGVEPTDMDALGALHRNGAIRFVDRAALLDANEIPLELRASQERPILEQAVQDAAREALAADTGDETDFKVKLDQVQSLVESLRPHRIAAERRRTAQSIDLRLTTTPLGHAILTERGERLLQSRPALDPAQDLADSIADLEQSYLEASVKAERLESLYAKLPESATRPAVAAALADLGDDTATSLELYEATRAQLEANGSALTGDGLDIPAIAALLVMNHDDADVAEFVDAYQKNRGRGFEPGDAVEYALAGLKDRREVDFIRRESQRLGLPIAITAALIKRRDDGPEVYEELSRELAAEGVTGDSRKTIAGLLAISLEPAQAVRRWLEARAALAALGLSGSYADIAAAFGASDPRGPRQFALAYAAQRQALAKSSIDDADRFAPELAHAGTRDRRDSWTGERIPRGLSTFDPYTLLFYHWVITRGHRGSYGWEPIYRDTSWAGDRNSWWGGGGGFGGGGSSSGGSTWGGGGFSGGGFGGFGGGGGFSGGGGGGSGW